MALRRAASSKGFQDDRYRRLIGALVKARQEQELSQQALAERIGLHQQFVSRYELGERRLDVVEFIDVARALELDVERLIGAVILRSD